MRTPFRACLLAVSFAGLLEVPVQAQPAVLTNADIVRMVASGLGDAVIIAMIEAAEEVAFDVSENGMNELLGAGVSDDVLIALLSRPQTEPPVVVPDPPVEPPGAAAAGDTPLVSDGQSGEERSVSQRMAGDVPRASLGLRFSPRGGELNGEVYIWRNLAIGAASGGHDHVRPVVSGEQFYGHEYTLTSVDIRAVATFPVLRGFLSVFGGPSFFSGFDVYEVGRFGHYYRGSVAAPGIHLGLDYAYYLTRYFGVGAGVTFHAASTRAYGRTHSVSYGLALLGLRVRF